MKLEPKNDPALFVMNHDCIKNIVISIKNKITFFPDIQKQDRGYYRELYYNDLVAKIMEQYPSEVQMVALREDGSVLYVIKKEWVHSYWTHSSSHAVFICEGSDKVSVSQIKMEFNSFIDGFEKQAKNKKLFSSIFDW